MRASQRTTPALLDVLQELLCQPVHGYKLARDTGNYTGTVYLILAKLVDAQWARTLPDPAADRTLYQLTEEGAQQARVLLAARRPGFRQPAAST